MTWSRIVYYFKQSLTQFSTLLIMWHRLHSQLNDSWPLMFSKEFSRHNYGWNALFAKHYCYCSYCLKYCSQFHRKRWETTPILFVATCRFCWVYSKNPLTDFSTVFTSSKIFLEQFFSCRLCMELNVQDLKHKRPDNLKVDRLAVFSIQVLVSLEQIPRYLQLCDVFRYLVVWIRYP